jgi:hypothetical protein
MSGTPPELARLLRLAALIAESQLGRLSAIGAERRRIEARLDDLTRGTRHATAPADLAEAEARVRHSAWAAGRARLLRTDLGAIEGRLAAEATGAAQAVGRRAVLEELAARARRAGREARARREI